MNNTTEYLSVASVAARYQVSVPTVWRWLRQGNFPEPVRFGERCTRWPVSALLEWESRKGGAA